MPRIDLRRLNLGKRGRSSTFCCCCPLSLAAPDRFESSPGPFFGTIWRDAIKGIWYRKILFSLKN